jgi:hypothetical protein
VEAGFARHGLRVDVDPARSRQIATSVDLGGYDVAFPSSAPAAEKIQREKHITRSYTRFHSPMAIASFESIVRILHAQGITHLEADGTRTFDTARFMALAGMEPLGMARPPGHPRRTPWTSAMYRSAATVAASGVLPWRRASR